MISPIAFTIFGRIPIYWYGISYVVSFFLCEKLLKLYIKWYPNKIFLQLEDLDNLAFYMYIGILFGGRLGEFLFFQHTIFTKEIFYIHHGGMSFHGALIGCCISIYLFSKKNKKNMINLLDILCLPAPIGLFLGRLANHINQEFKSIILFNKEHPIALYEAFFEGILLFIILNYKNNLDKKAYNLSNALIYYGIFRGLIEFIRIGKQIYGINISQILSFLMILIGVFIKLFYKSALDQPQAKQKN